MVRVVAAKAVAERKAAKMQQRTPPMPRGFLPAEDIEWVKMSPVAPPFIRSGRRAGGRRAQGLRYEKKVQEMLLTILPEQYVPSPWLYFAADGKIRWCQPDGLIFDTANGVITIVEIKYQHTTDAWWQLYRLYLPVVREMFPRQLWKIRTLEIVKWFDPQVAWPLGVKLAEDPRALPQTDLTCVHIWKP